MIKDLSKSLIAAVAEINKKSLESFATEQKALQEKSSMTKSMAAMKPKAETPAVAGAAEMAKKNMKEAAGGTTPKTPQEKKLAAMTHPKDKITHGDVLHGRGVRKEGFDDMMKAVKARAAEKGTGKFDVKKVSTGTVYTRKPETFDDGGKDADMKKAEKKMKKEEVVVESPVAGVAAGSMEGDKHMCASKVMHKEWKEGRPLFSQHAEPSKDGSIDWYDVMFEHGIEKKVPTSDLEILVSESHMSHKKGKK